MKRCPVNTFVEPYCRSRGLSTCLMTEVNSRGPMVAMLIVATPMMMILIAAMLRVAMPRVAVPAVASPIMVNSMVATPTASILIQVMPMVEMPRIASPWLIHSFSWWIPVVCMILPCDQGVNCPGALIRAPPGSCNLAVPIFSLVF
jgi:hypothetical protein